MEVSTINKVVTGKFQKGSVCQAKLSIQDDSSPTPKALSIKLATKTNYYMDVLPTKANGSPDISAVVDGVTHPLDQYMFLGGGFSCLQDRTAVYPWSVDAPGCPDPSIFNSLYSNYFTDFKFDATNSKWCYCDVVCKVIVSICSFFFSFFSPFRSPYLLR